jgi:outer membrane protein
MKKISAVCVAIIATLLLSTNTHAQTKIGSFDEDGVLGLFPGLQPKVDSALQQFTQDSLKGQYDFAVSEYKRIDSTLKDTINIKGSLRTMLQKQWQQNLSLIQNWQQYQQQQLQQKQEEILYPYKQKVYAALDAIIKEQKYTHVFKSDVLLYAQPSDNLSIKVARKLNLPLPKEVEEAIKAQEAAQNGGGSGGTKPSTTPANRPVRRN